MAPIKRPLSKKTLNHRKKVRFFARTTSSDGISPIALPAPVISEVIGADP
ncbi:MAG: hypothetical protein JRE65_05355 [Deltaproteobacteria bacterium]|jgi:hypothetical protein|nr:hypothetical protein [Deltaproteobacteria bacterium]